MCTRGAANVKLLNRFTQNIIVIDGEITCNWVYSDVNWSRHANNKVILARYEEGLEYAIRKDHYIKMKKGK